MLKGIQRWNLDLWNVAPESGQTSAEYVAVSAVGVAIALGVIYFALHNPLNTAVSNIGDALNSFISGIL